MPEPFSTEHLTQLRQRWERDPKSRAFLQLAEEYRRAGRLPDAMHILRAGLEEHPTYLSAQVALGRCLVESDSPDAAVEILERAVARDPTQLVANKLLVEAYLALGQATKARERLNLYKLFNDRDSEIETLEARIRTLENPVAADVATKRIAPREARDGALFDLPAPESLPDVRLESALASPRFSAGVTANEPFGTLYASGAARRIEAALAEQAIFTLAPPVAATLADPAVAEPAPATFRTVAAPTATFIEVAALSAIADDGLPESPLPPALPAASATLGELYLAQGHLDEAEESFQSVLRSRPTDTAALAGLESVRLQRGEEAAVFADEVVAAEESNHIVGGLTARKASLLKDYLARIRRGAKRHVS